MDYNKLKEELEYILSSEDEIITTLANASAILNSHLSNINWVGFYIYKDNSLYLGPFQGLHACTRIKSGKGVCGLCIKTMKTIVVGNVHEFEGHIACDSRSNSEICIPLAISDKPFGLLDIDSTLYNRFAPEDTKNLEEIALIIQNKLINK